MKTWGSLGCAALSGLLLVACGDDDDGGGGGAPDARPADAALATPDAAVVDAAATGPDAALPDFALFGVVAGNLVEIDVTTGEQTSIGAVGLDVSRFAFDPVSNTLFAVHDNITNASLSTVNVCTGAAASLGALTMPGNFIDGFEVDPATGVLYATVSANGDFPADALAEQLVTIDVTTREATMVADFSGSLTDGDSLLFGLAEPIGVDVNTVSQTLTLYDIDLSTAVASNMRVAGPPLVALPEVHDGLVYGIGASGAINGQLATANPTTGDTAGIGGTFAINDVAGLVSARGCPD